MISVGFNFALCDKGQKSVDFLSGYSDQTFKIEFI